MMMFPPEASRPSGQRGYALLFAMFLVATLVILGTAASRVIRTEGLRQKEEELVWRGNQYVRAIRLYFRKNGRFPKNLEDLTKYKFGEVRYIRRAYKDPLNNEDGSWRLIYMAPNGQLIGSVMKKSLGLAGLPGMQSPPGTGTGSQNPAGSQNPPGTQNPPASENPPASPTNPPASGAQNPQLPGSEATGQGAAQEQVISEGQMMGGSLVGVASKVKRNSIRIFNDGRTYFQWEFIWDPSKTGGAGGATPPKGPNPIGNLPVMQPAPVPPPPPKQNPL